VHLYVADGVTFLVLIPVLVAMLPRVVGRVTAPPCVGKPRPGYRQVLSDRVFLKVWLLIAALVTIGVRTSRADVTTASTRSPGPPAW